MKLFKDLNAKNICIGTSETIYISLNIDSKVAVKETHPSTVRHLQCLLLIDHTSERCVYCSHYRGSLRKLVSKLSKKNGLTQSTFASSRAPLSSLNNQDLVARAKNLATQHKNQNTKIETLKKRIASATFGNQVAVSNELNTLCHTTITEQLASANAKCSDVKRLFLEQQIKASMLKNAKSMR